MKKVLLTALFGLTLSVAAHAQILEVDPESMGKPVYRPSHTGLTLQGSTGLVTIPTPDFKQDHPISITSRSGTSKQDSLLNGYKYRLSKYENYSGLSYFLKDNLELSVNHLYYHRTSNPYIKGLDQKEDSTGLGIKYSVKNGKQDFCCGATLAPMSAEEINKADLSQIENLRNVYMTLTEDLDTNLRGYLHAKTCFTKGQKIDLGNGNTVELQRKDFIVSALGFEYMPGERFSLFCESQFFNYRDLFQERTPRYSFNSGIRFGSKGLQLEALGLSLNQSPRAYLGAAVGF